LHGHFVSCCQARELNKIQEGEIAC
jgi:hypothetical protein